MDKGTVAQRRTSPGGRNPVSDCDVNPDGFLQKTGKNKGAGTCRGNQREYCIIKKGGEDKNVQSGDGIRSFPKRMMSTDLTKYRTLQTLGFVNTLAPR